jgi:hypothetical protein
LVEIIKELRLRRNRLEGMKYVLWEKKERQKEGESVEKWTGRKRERGLGGARVRKKE